mmetsp:Transcript_29941/g.72169  ORF Transcript_29941/g.72169 Transcript_29941/m.72169 type:complete len:212 (+) Transcript_29941:111-746(+)
MRRSSASASCARISSSIRSKASKASRDASMAASMSSLACLVPTMSSRRAESSAYMRRTSPSIFGSTLPSATSESNCASVRRACLSRSSLLRAILRMAASISSALPSTPSIFCLCSSFRRAISSTCSCVPASALLSLSFDSSSRLVVARWCSLSFRASRSVTVMDPWIRLSDSRRAVLSSSDSAQPVSMWSSMFSTHTNDSLSSASVSCSIS